MKHPVFSLCYQCSLSAQAAEHRHGQVCGGGAGDGAGRLPRRAARHLRGDALQGSPHHRDVQGEYKGTRDRDLGVNDVRADDYCLLQGSQWQPWGCMMHKYTRTDTER